MSERPGHEVIYRYVDVPDCSIAEHSEQTYNAHYVNTPEKVDTSCKKNQAVIYVGR